MPAEETVGAFAEPVASGEVGLPGRWSLDGSAGVAQGEESLAAVDLELTDAQRARLDGAR